MDQPLGTSPELGIEQLGHLLTTDALEDRTWSLPDEDNLPAGETLQMQVFIQQALQDLDEAEAKKHTLGS